MAENLEVDDLLKLAEAIVATKLDRVEFRLHPDSMLYSDYKIIEKMNRNPLGGYYIPVVEDKFMPVGLIAQVNREEEPRTEPRIMVCKLNP